MLCVCVCVVCAAEMWSNVWMCVHVITVCDVIMVLYVFGACSVEDTRHQLWTRWEHILLECCVCVICSNISSPPFLFSSSSSTILIFVPFTHLPHTLRTHPLSSPLPPYYNCYHPLLASSSITLSLCSTGLWPQSPLFFFSIHTHVHVCCTCIIVKFTPCVFLVLLLSLLSNSSPISCLMLGSRCIEQLVNTYWTWTSCTPRKRLTSCKE